MDGENIPIEEMEIEPGASRDPKDQPDSKPTHIVGIGASAGGLEAIETFFDKMPDDSGLAFVVVQHLSPDFKSLMDELLRRHTRMEIRRVEDGMLVEANVVYLIPPKKEMILSGGRLRLEDRDLTQGLNLPIDVFFRSLAQDAGDKAVGIVLSGTGSDGSRGILDIHEAGGLVMVQREDSAKFDGMPSSAIRTGISDYVVSPDEMPAALLKFINHPLSREIENTYMAHAQSAIEGTFTRIFDLLHNEFKIDFNEYKKTTISRRIERRMAFHHFKNLDDYVEHLRENHDELESLYKDLLIGVTRFFRDPEAFHYLQDQVVPEIVQNADPHEEIRIWVPGCATGEEVYSLGILFHECARNSGIHPNFKIFATDIHRDLLDFAAYGVFSDAMMENVSSERQEKYFVKEGENFQVVPELRKMVVFAEHNLIKDPPFTKIDLVSCRNLLIYFMPSSQKKVISLFHFALKTKGYLFLGPSESIGELETEFDTLSHRWKIFQKRRNIRLPLAMRFASGRLTAGGVLSQNQGQAMAAPYTPGYSTDIRLSRAYDKLLEKYIPPSVLIDERREIVHMFGDVNHYFKHPPGRMKLDILNMVQGDLRIALSTAINRARKNSEQVIYSNIRYLRDEGQPPEVIRLTVSPIVEKSVESCYLLVCIEQVRIRTHKDSEPTDGFDVSEESMQRIGDLEQELQYTKENLQATVEELETSNEELQASNEELMASNEELQSTNEELHSVNEELYTVNGEYERKIKELTELTNDMDNLLRSTEIGTVFLDTDLRIRKFTPAIGQSFNLLDQDIGRPIDHISYNFVGNPDMMEDLEAVLKSQKVIEREVQNHQGQWFLKRILPYFNEFKEVAGVVMTFVDISQIKRAEKSLAQSEARFRSLVENNPAVMYEALIEHDGDRCRYKPLYLSPHITRVLGFQADEFITGRKQWIDVIHPEDRQAFQNAIGALNASNRHLSIEYRVLGENDREIWIHDEADVTGDANQGNVHIQGVMTDITETKRAQIVLKQSEQRMRAASDASLDGFYLLRAIRNQSDEIVDFEFMTINQPGEKLLNMEKSRLIGKRLCEAFPLFRREIFFNRYKQVVETGRPYEVEAQISEEVIQARWLHQQVVRVDDGIAVTTRDITQEKEDSIRLTKALRELETKNAEMERFVYTVSHDLKSPLVTIKGFLGWLERHISNNETDKVYSDIQRIANAIDKMDSSFGELLELSRLGRVVSVPEEMNLSRIAAEAAELIEGLIKERNVKVRIDKKMPSIHGDRNRIRQVFENLIANAVKFIGDQPNPAIEIGARKEPEAVVFHVRDNGIGIENEYKEKIFTLFEKLDQNSEGTGAGLAIVRRIIEAHGGKVWVESKGRGEGTSFYCRIPDELPFSSDPDSPK